MIPNHKQFLEALNEQRKVRVQFYSQPDSGMLDRVCAPLDYGPGAETKDGLNRYWLWDYASTTGSQKLGLVPDQIKDLKVLGETFDPRQFAGKASPAPVAKTDSAPLSPLTNTAAGGKPPIL